MTHVRLDDGTVWPMPDGDLEWRLRYAPELSEEDIRTAASILHAYEHLTVVAPRRQQARVVKAIRRRLRE